MSIDAALGRLGIQTGVCTSSTRPANPYQGQVIYETDTNNLRFWSGSAWESNKGAVISSAAPSSPAAGDIWYDSDDGRAYVYYDDGSSQQWVEFGAPPSGSTIALASYADSAARTTAIPSPTEADLSYLQDTNKVEVYDGSAWAAVGYGGLVHISRTTIGSAVSSVTVSDAFSADYNNYKIIVSGGSCSADTHLYFQFSPTSATGYYYSLVHGSYTGAGPSSTGGSNTDRVVYVGGGVSMVANFEVTNPYDSARTKELIARVRYGTVYGTCVAHVPLFVSYSSFIVGPHTGTITGGNIDVYGYAES